MNFRLLLILLITTTFAHALSVNINLLCKEYFNRPSETELRAYFKDRKMGLYGERPDKELLLLLINLIEVYNVPGPMDFIFLKEEGPEKIFRFKDSFSQIMITKNAGEGLLSQSIANVATEVCLKKSQESDFIIEYNNTVFEQFLRALVPKNIILRELKKHTGLSFRSSASDVDFSKEQEFRREELISLYKNFIDIPPHVFNKLALKSMVRMRIGAELVVDGMPAKAVYDPVKEKISLTGNALMENENDIYGEGTILHEIGHAFAKDFDTELMEKFYQISWKKVNGEWRLKRNDSPYFISEYSMKSPEEDFAEHFSAYVHQAEKLRYDYNEKYLFLRDNVFVDTEYFSMVANNARVYIDSKITDSEKPALLGNVKKSFKFIVEETEKTNIYVSLSQAYDDLSGINDGFGTLYHTELKDYRIFMRLNPVDSTQKETMLLGTVKYDPARYAPGTYELRTFSLSDKAGNIMRYKDYPIASIKLGGDLGTQKRKFDLDVSKIKITPEEKIDGYPVYSIELPLKHLAELDAIFLNWEAQGIEEKTRHFISKFTSNAGEDKIKFKFAFYKQYPTSSFNLSTISFRFKGNEKYAPSRYNITMQRRSNTTIMLDTNESKLKLNEADVNGMRLRAKKKLNKHEGIHNITVKLPLKGKRYANSQFSIVLRDPKGKKIYHHYNEAYEKRNPPPSTDSFGNVIYTFDIPLKKYPKKGYYIIESIKTTTNYPKPSFTREIAIDTGSAFVDRQKTLERGVRKKLKIFRDKEDTN